MELELGIEPELDILLSPKMCLKMALHAQTCLFYLNLFF